MARFSIGKRVHRLGATDAGEGESMTQPTQFSEPSGSRSVCLAAMAPKTTPGGYYITAAALWPMVMGLRVLRMDVDKILAAADISAEALRDPETRLGHEQAFRLIAAALEASGDENVGLRLSLLYEPGAFGVLDYLGQSARNLRESLEVLM